MNNFFLSLSEGDTSLMKQVTTDDFILFEHDVIWNTDSLLELMPMTLGRIWEIRDFQHTATGHFAHVHYFNISKSPKGKSWLESALLVKENQQLKIKFMHSTKLYLNEQ
ncbi:MAG: hypothetical protein R3345_11520 [Fulvivirga sp.]|nr:hypothetical protein [Fulvivirga sp.]